MRSFTSYPWEHGSNFVIDHQFDTIMRCVVDGALQVEREKRHVTTYGYVESGVCVLFHDDCEYDLQPGMFFSAPGLTHIAAQGRVMLVQRFGYRGVFHLGGRIEHRGRLRYIDGCTDSLLIPPQRYGEPCLNLLYFPPGIEQTMHTHPSSRSGLILSGAGVCDTPEGQVDLLPGTLFCIHTDGPHRFITTDSEMRVLAFHPDSDFGPKDEDHPMLNRTFVGTAAGGTQIAGEEIRTKKTVEVEYEMTP
jgi:quercetin dioxygenase-like cupin family protein